MFLRKKETGPAVKLVVSHPANNLTFSS
jgi:hypothetical protein